MKSEEVVYDFIKELIPIKNHLKIRNEDDVLIVSSPSMEVEFFNETARDFYLLIDDKTPVYKIIDKLYEMYEIDKNILISDILILIRNLQWKKIILLKEEL
jgi:hypothetical protein